MTQTSIIEYLKNHWLFDQRSGPELNEISKKLTEKNYSVDEYLFHQHDEPDRLYLILTGEVSVETTSIGGRTTVLANLMAGEIFGEFAIIDSGLRSASARIVTNSRVASMSGDSFLQIIKAYPEIGLKLASVLVLRLRDSNRKLESVNTETLPQRVVSLLLQLCREASDANTTTIKLTQSDLAIRLSASREKVNRHLHTLQDRGLIKLGRGTFDVLDIEGLKALVHWY